MRWSGGSHAGQRLGPWLFAALLALVVPAYGRIDEHPSSGAATASEKAVADYPLGPGDVLTITIADAPELSGKVRVTEAGEVVLAALPTPIKAEGLSALELSRAIAAALKAAELLRDPAVTVFVEEYHSRTVTVLGAVGKPSVYPLQKPTTLLEVLSMAGGLLPSAGTKLTLVRKEPVPVAKGTSAEQAPPLGDSKRTIDLAKLMLGEDPSLNVEVRAGDIVSVSTAPIIYVVGAVNKPGGFALQDPNAGLTVLQALGMAEGLKPNASGSRCVIIRGSPGAKDRKEVPIDLGKLMERKIPDQQLASNDILFIPESKMKKSLRAMGTAAQQAVNGIAVYGIGYRLGTRK